MFRSLGNSTLEVALEGILLSRPRMLDWSVSVYESLLPSCDPQMNARHPEGIKTLIKGRMRGRHMHTMPMLLSTLIQMSSGITLPANAVSSQSQQ